MRGASALSQRKKKEKPNPTNVTKDSYYVILAPKHHSFDNLWILPADMDDTKEKGGTVLHPRMFEARAAAYQVEGGNLAERVLCLLEGSHWLLALWPEGLTEAWDREEAPMTPGNTNVCLVWVPPEPYFGNHWLKGHNYREYLWNNKQAKFK